MTKNKKEGDLQEQTYPIVDLIAHHDLIGWNKECVVAALRLSGATEMTLREAKHTVEEFMRRSH